MTDRIEQHSLTELDIQESPWQYYQAMNERRFYYDDRLDMFICANYQLMREIMRQPKRFSSVNSQNIAHMREPPAEVLRIQKEMLRPVNILVSSDPPEHTRVRKMLDDPFRPHQIATLRTQIIAIVNNIVDQFIPASRCEIVSDFAIPIPVTVIADLLGIDRAHAQVIKASLCSALIQRRITASASRSQAPEARPVSLSSVCGLA